MQVRIEERPAVRVAFVRKYGPYAESAKAAWESLCGWASRHELLGPQTVTIGVCHDNPDTTPPAQIRYDAAIPIEGDVPVEGDVQLGEIAGGLYAVYPHRGPMETLKDAWMEFAGRGISEAGYQMIDLPSFEIYRTDCTTTPPEEQITELYLGVAPKA